MTAVKTAETIESQNHSALWYAELPKYAETQREAAKMNMLMRWQRKLPEWRKHTQTQREGRDTEVGNMKIDSSTKVAGHCAKSQALAACEGGPEGRAIRFDDCERTSWKERLQGMDLMKLAEQLDRTTITASICYSK